MRSLRADVAMLVAENIHAATLTVGPGKHNVNHLLRLIFTGPLEQDNRALLPRWQKSP